MSRGQNQKLKLYFLNQIMLERTDETHWLTMSEILKALEEYEVTAERKSIYTDLQELKIFGTIVDSEQRGKLTYYHVIERTFDLPELKLLVDAIQSSKFITVNKTNKLISKLEAFCSKEDAKKLQRQVFVQNRIKNMNETIYYSVDAIHEAISENKQIKFQYFKWNLDKEMVPTHDGQYISVSPWALTWDDENYYLVAYDAVAEKIKHYRVDKMAHISTTDEMRQGKEHFKMFDTASYAKKNFAMYGGEEEIVVVELKNEMCGVFIDRFGKDISFQKVDSEHSKVRLKVALSRHFFGWIFALGPDVRIVGPESVVKQVNEEIERLKSQYNFGAYASKLS